MHDLLFCLDFEQLMVSTALTASKTDMNVLDMSAMGIDDGPCNALLFLVNVDAISTADGSNYWTFNLYHSDAKASDTALTDGVLVTATTGLLNTASPVVNATTLDHAGPEADLDRLPRDESVHPAPADRDRHGCDHGQRHRRRCPDRREARRQARLMLSSSPANLIHPSLVKKPAPENAMKPTQITMLKDGKGYTRHDGPPHLVEFKKGDEPVVSDDLAMLWVASGTCELRRPAPEVKRDFAAQIKELKAAQAAHEKKVKAAKARLAAKVAKTQGKKGGLRSTVPAKVAKQG